MVLETPRNFINHLWLFSRATALTTPWVLHLFFADILLSLLLPVSTIYPTWSYNVSSNIAESVWHGIQLICTRFNGADITISGAELPMGESAIVVANHVEWTDFYMIQELAIRAGMLGRCRWFAKQQLKWVPFLGWGLWAMGMPLVSRKWMVDKREIDRVFYGVLQRHWPLWLISYSEATRYTPAKHAEAVQWCKANKKTIPRHTLHPRTRGFIACVQNLRKAPHVKAVYDLTIAYAKGSKFMAHPTFAQTLLNPSLGRDYRFHVHADRYLLQELPQTDEELAKWLEDRWVEKGDRLEAMRDKLSRSLPWTGPSITENATPTSK